MSLFQRIHQEKNERIHFQVLLNEISLQENITLPEACAVIAREAAEHADDVPLSFYEPFYLYDYTSVDGFTRNEWYSTQSLSFLRSMASGREYEEMSEFGEPGYYRRVGDWDGEIPYKEFYFKGSELATSFVDAGVELPPCLKRFELLAKKRIQLKTDRLNESKKQKTTPDVSIKSLQEEIISLRLQIEKITREKPILLGEFRDNDPLLLAIEVRNKEWLKYDPENDRETRAKQGAIVKELEDMGLTNAQAKAIELVACPINR